MTRAWAHILMGLIFVVATISSPLHAQSMTASHGAAPAAEASSPHMSGMSEACAKAMSAQAAKTKSPKPGTDGQAGGCGSIGCNCPLSHCPATPSLPATAPAAPVHDDAVILAYPASPTLVSIAADALIRPPRV